MTVVADRLETIRGMSPRHLPENFPEARGPAGTMRQVTPDAISPHEAVGLTAAMGGGLADADRLPEVLTMLSRTAELREGTDHGGTGR